MSSRQPVPSRPVGRGVLIRYRIMAYVTAVLLLVLVFVAIPIQIWGHDKTMEAIVGQLHGFLYMVYLVTAFEITVRLRVPLGRMLLVLLAGTVPFGAFFAERSLTRTWRARAAQSPPPRPQPSQAEVSQAEVSQAEVSRPPQPQVSQPPASPDGGLSTAKIGTESAADRPPSQR